ncbi:MAG: dockerin type I domain-containing protein, partial [Candidatus Omnitrophica bacterium]|nr:dockerin type I domain-containing protein [Candidatus Omnitrophota bacterium]
ISYNTSVNWTSSTQATGEPTPKASGGSETMTITGLNGGTTYYFALKVIDSASNTSNLSNVVSFKTYNTADLSRDYLINSVDFGVLMSYWNSTSKPAADSNQDGIVNSVDFGIMMSQWGSY